MKKLISISLLFTCLNCFGQSNLNLVPMPAEVKMGELKNPFQLSNNVTIITASEGLKNEANYLAKFLNDKYGLTVAIKKGPVMSGLVLNIDENFENKQDGAYVLDIFPSQIYIGAKSSKGVFSGIQTLIQLIDQNNAPKNYSLSTKKLSIPTLSISDYPRFQYRGMHLDVARHFMPVDFLKKYIDYLAAYKFNTFHWHLTDDQGWRIEIKKYPLLTQVGGWRNGTIIGRYPGTGNTNTKHGGFYTQAQVKEIVKYAADRYITVIPEIEMPGHASAAIAAYPQLSCFPQEDTKIPQDCIWSGAAKGKMVQQTWGVFEDVFAPTDYTFNFLQDVLDEVVQLFPSKYIHIGGDECPKEAWKRSDFCKRFIKEKNLKDEHGLQSYFIQRIEKYLNNKGRNIIGWDEILEGGLAPNATVMSWRGEEGGIEAAKQNHTVIMTPGKPVYFDHSQSKNEDSVTIGGYNSLEDVYAYEPIPAALNASQAKYVLGAQANMWTEYMKNERKIEYMLFPRMAALSEVLWSPKEKRNWVDFETRLPTIFERLEKQKINYSKAYYDLKATVLPGNDNGSINFKLESNLPNADIRYQYFTSQFYNYDNLIPLGKGVDVNFSLFKNDKPVKLSTQKFLFNKATGKKITLATQASKNYPGDGAFTLVNGVQNEKGLARSSEFLGFNGADLDATIDLGALKEINSVTLHAYAQAGSWIHLPTQVQVQYLSALDNAGMNVTSPAITEKVDVTSQQGNVKITVAAKHQCRYVRVTAKNLGSIPVGNPGAGEKAWLFVHEIEVE
jgi:hexosaminidase